MRALGDIGELSDDGLRSRSSLGVWLAETSRRGSSCITRPQYTRTQVRRALPKRSPQEPRAAPRLGAAECRARVGFARVLWCLGSQCLEASWRTGGAPAVAAQSPGVFRRACVSPTRIFFPRRAKREPRDSGLWARGEPPARRETHRETRDTGSPRHQRPQARPFPPLRATLPRDVRASIRSTRWTGREGREREREHAFPSAERSRPPLRGATRADRPGAMIPR